MQSNCDCRIRVIELLLIQFIYSPFLFSFSIKNDNNNHNNIVLMDFIHHCKKLTQSIAIAYYTRIIVICMKKNIYDVFHSCKHESVRHLNGKYSWIYFSCLRIKFKLNFYRRCTCSISYYYYFYYRCLLGNIQMHSN